MLRISLLSLVCLSTLYAHKINLFAYDEAGKLHVQSYFTKSSPCKQCTVRLMDEHQKELALFKTDDEGKASIELPSSTFNIMVEGGMGHQTQTYYVAQTRTQETSKALPSDTPFEKMALGLAIIAFFFGVLFWIKRKRIRP